MLRRAPIIRILFAIGLLCFTACREGKATVEGQFLRGESVRSPIIRAELAVTAEEKQLGLMYRKALSDDEAMLFLFQEEKPRSFWMKNTYLELDIIFLDADMRIVSISKKATPLTETPRPSTAPSKFVLEVRGGLTDKWQLEPGDQLSVKQTLPTGQ